MNRVPFQDADVGTRRFYTAVFFHAMVNIEAVRRGYYPTLLCETEDPLAAIKWKEALPQILAAMRTE